MGLVLDASVLIAAELEAKPSARCSSCSKKNMLRRKSTLIEIEHRFHRANTPELAQRRRDYLDTALAAIPTEPFTKEMAQLAAKIDTEAKKKGPLLPVQTC